MPSCLKWLLAPVLSASCSLAAGNPIVLRVVAQESVPPKWLTGQGASRGICPDILAAIERIEPRLRFTGHAEKRSVPYIEQGLASGSVDAACAILDTERRRAIAQVAGPPLYIVRHRLAARHDDSIQLRSLDELVRLAPLINTPRNAGYAGQLRALGLVVDDSSGDNLVNLRKIIAGHGRFFYMNELTLAWLLTDQSVRGKVRMLDWVVREEPIYFHVSKKAPPGAARMVGDALATLRERGELARIYASWSVVR